MSIQTEEQTPPFQFSILPQTKSKKFLQDFPTYVDGLAISQPNGYVNTPEFARHAEKLYKFQPKSDDVWIMTFPKCGTTWMQELVWLVTNNCDFEKAKQSLHIRSPFFEMAYLLPKFLLEKYERDTIARKCNIPMISKVLEMLSYWKLTDMLRPMVMKVINFLMGNMMRNLKELDEMKERRILKTHLPMHFLNPTLLSTSKVVYVARNPKDVIVSYFHYHKLMDYHQYSGDIETFAEYFMKNEVFNAPYFPHLLDAWNKRHHPNLHFVFYEDLKSNLRGEIDKVAKFLNKSLTDEQLSKLTEHLRFDSFAKNEAVNNEFGKEFGIIKNNGHFIRKGKTGDWKNHFSPELNSRIDAWIDQNLQGTNLRFITELEQQD